MFVFYRIFSILCLKGKYTINIHSSNKRLLRLYYFFCEALCISVNLSPGHGKIKTLLRNQCAFIWAFRPEFKNVITNQLNNIIGLRCWGRFMEGINMVAVYFSKNFLFYCCANCRLYLRTFRFFNFAEWWYKSVLWPPLIIIAVVH